MKFLIQIVCCIFLTNAAHSENVAVFAAASMKTALDHISTVYTANTKTNVVATYGSTATLAKQIEQAAPADIFISADLAWMDALNSKNLIKMMSRKNIVGNSLVLIRQKSDLIDESEQRDPMQRLKHIHLANEKLAMADVNSAPAGKYGKQALEKLRIWEAVKGDVVMQDNVRAALALVARGEARYGIVYGSDAKAEPNVEVVAVFSADSHPPILYPAAILATSKNPDAQAFLDFLSSKEARDIFKADGFSLLE